MPSHSVCHAGLSHLRWTACGKLQTGHSGELLWKPGRPCFCSEQERDSTECRHMVCAMQGSGD